MIIYKRFENIRAGKKSWRYTKDGLICKSDRVPAEILPQFEHTDVIKYDEQPEKKRCLFCDAPSTHKRIVSLVLVDLCNVHYYSKTLGSLVAELRQINERKDDGINTITPKSGSKKRKSKLTKSNT